MLSEKDILSVCQKKPSEGQRLLYIKYAPLLKGVCKRYIRDHEEAADVVQDAFVKIFKKLNDFQSNGSLEGWLKRILVNTALDYLSKKKVKQEVSFPSDETTMDIREAVEAEEGNIISDMIDLGFTKEMLIQLLHELPEHYATVFNLFFIDELSHKDIAALLNITEGNSRKLAFRAKEQIKILLIKHIKYSNEATNGR